MPSVAPNTTIAQYQKFVEQVYGLPNQRYFTIQDMSSNVVRFATRGLKGIRKGDHDKTKINLLITLSWFMSTLNQLHINLEDEVWLRFPYLCSYCGACPCSCKEKKIKSRQKVPADGLVDSKKRPKTLEDFQRMFEKIYPSKSRTLEHAGVHLAEELGELSEAILTYRGGYYKDAYFERVKREAADFFSCIVGVFNSLNVNIAKELATVFSNNCHVCKKAPCECSFISVMRFKS